VNMRMSSTVTKVGIGARNPTITTVTVTLQIKDKVEASVKAQAYFLQKEFN